MKRSMSGAGWTFLALYVFINALFVYKYSTRFLPHSSLWTICYTLGACALFFTLIRDFDLKLNRRANNGLFIFSVILIAIILAFVMRHFNPAQIRVTRYPALHDWISRLLTGQYPYTSSARPSGFPFLFLVAVPFYLLGDLGLLQIFVFLIFAYIIHHRFGSDSTNRLRVLILLVLSPVFLYEIAVRSDLFSNMVLVNAFMIISRHRVMRARTPALIILGIIGGLFLATRGIVLLIYIIYFGFLFRNQIARGITFAGALISGFAISCLPFLLWNTNHFMRQGPFAIQMAYLPVWLSAFFILICAYVALRVRSDHGAYQSITYMLFGSVVAAFIISLYRLGWPATVLGDRFDISYFCFTLPFLLLSYDYERKSSTGPGWFFNTAQSSD